MFERLRVCNKDAARDASDLDEMSRRSLGDRGEVGDRGDFDDEGLIGRDDLGV